MKGLRKYLTPFAPDQSGAVSVLFELGGIVVICDAGGCTGNVCGFDEPRWHGTRSAVFSAGLRDMDAILGRDDKLVAELADAATKVEARFAAIVGTPVPAVIGTDYRALARMARRSCDLPVITVDTSGTRLYDDGARKAYRALFDRFATEAYPVEQGRIGVLGANPLDLSCIEAADVCATLPDAVTYGMGSSLDDVIRASSVERNVVVAPSGLATAKLLEERFGTPYEFADPRFGSAQSAGLDMAALVGKRVLVVHQQVTAHSIRQLLLAHGAQSVTCATWFMQLPELIQQGDAHLAEEDDFTKLVAEGGFDAIVGDPALWPIIPSFAGELISLPHFALSGILLERGTEGGAR